MRVTWDASIGEVSGYKVQMIPMMTGSKRQELYVGPGQSSVVVRDLSPDTEYQISLYALKGLTPSEPVTVMQKTQPVTVSLGEYKIVMVQGNKHGHQTSAKVRTSRKLNAINLVGYNFVLFVFPV